jgi:hypothetical protein
MVFPLLTNPGSKQEASIWRTIPGNTEKAKKKTIDAIRNFNISPPQAEDQSVNQYIIFDKENCFNFKWRLKSCTVSWFQPIITG